MKKRINCKNLILMFSLGFILAFLCGCGSESFVKEMNPAKPEANTINGENDISSKTTDANSSTLDTQWDAIREDLFQGASNRNETAEQLMCYGAAYMMLADEYLFKTMSYLKYGGENVDKLQITKELATKQETYFTQAKLV